MKVTLEFTDVEKFFTELPRFAALISYSAQYATFNHVDKSNYITSLGDADIPLPEPAEKKQKEKPEETKEEKPEDAKEEKPEETQKKKPATAKAVKAADVRKALNTLIKNGHREDVKKILAEFGADNFSALEEDNYQAVLEKAKEVLGE